MWRDLGRDVRWALRTLRRRPTFTAVAVMTLALGIGANSAIFTLVSAQFFAPLPWQRAEDLVLLWETEPNSRDVTTVAPGNYVTWRDETRSFEDVAAFNVDYATLSGREGPAERVEASYVTPRFFDVLGVSPTLGPGFDEASVREAAGRLVVLSHGLWTRRWGADPDLIGRDILIDGRPHTVVGVLPPEYRQPERSLSWQATELWRPLLLDDERDDFGGRYLRTVARLRPDVAVSEARLEMAAVAERMARGHPAENGGRSILVRPVADYLMGDARPTLYLLLAAGGAVFLVVCANVANLTLARGEERRREFAVRGALGSGRGRLVRQLLVEGVVLGFAGAGVGTVLLGVAQGSIRAVQARFFTGLVEATLDARVVAFTVLAAVAAGVLSGLPVARAASGSQIREALVAGGERSGAGRRSGVTRNLLIVGQVGLATSLLVVALLLVRSFGELVDVPPGFEPEGVMTFQVTAPPDREGREGVQGYFRDVWNELETIPDVAAVGLVSDMPFTRENRWTDIALPGRSNDPDDPPLAEYRTATPEYFQVMGIPLERGALLEPTWELRVPMPVLVNREMARRYWPDGDAVGQGFELRWRDTVSAAVVGVVGDVLDDGYRASPEPIFYAPFGTLINGRMSFVLEVSGDAAQVPAAVRDAVARVDPGVPVADLRMLESLMAETVVRPRAASLIGAVFALLALLVAAAGIYGVLSYLVQSRTREIGVRAALGAPRGRLMGMVMSQSLRLVALGLLLGSIGSLIAGRAISGLLFGVRPWDPPSLLVAAALLGGVGTLAAWLPARRAVAVDPREALRSE
jgi:predicted permease